jgi:endonuclease/exonuclease/phosphatase family metal-dependent hydrolase
MKIIQYNIYFGDDDRDATEMRLENNCRCLNEQMADVICLQEVLEETHDYLFALLKDKYPYSYSNQDPNLNKSTSMNSIYGTVILSRYPFKRTIKHKYEITTMNRDIKLVLIENDEHDKIYICTSHFESEFKDSCMRKKYQYERCSDILEQLYKRTQVPIILCADTNDNTENTFNNAFSYKNCWRDTWIENGRNENHEYTFDSKTNPILIEHYKNSKQNVRSRLDRVIHLSNFHCTEFKLIGNEKDIIMSDHYGIVCIFSKTWPINRKEYSILFLSKNNQHDHNKRIIPINHQFIEKKIEKILK